jgi:hypothetical protein
MLLHRGEERKKKKENNKSSSKESEKRVLDEYSPRIRAFLLDRTELGIVFVTTLRHPRDIMKIRLNCFTAMLQSAFHRLRPLLPAAVHETSHAFITSTSDISISLSVFASSSIFNSLFLLFLYCRKLAWRLACQVFRN